MTEKEIETEVNQLCVRLTLLSAEECCYFFLVHMGISLVV